FSEGTEKASIRYFLGMSALMGKENRIVVTGGYALGFVNKLSEQYTKTNGAYDPVPFTASDVSYVRKFQGKGFISLSYNLPIGANKSTQQVDVPAAAATKSDAPADKKDAAGKGDSEN